MQVPWAGQTHRYFWTVAEPVARSCPPAVLSLSAWGVGAGCDSCSRRGSRDSCLCLRRAAPSYFSAATARPSQLSTFVPGVNFRKQVRTPGEGCLMAGLPAVLGRGPWGQAQGPTVKRARAVCVSPPSLRGPVAPSHAWILARSVAALRVAAGCRCDASLNQ